MINRTRLRDGPDAITIRQTFLNSNGQNIKGYHGIGGQCTGTDGEFQQRDENYKKEANTMLNKNSTIPQVMNAFNIREQTQCSQGENQ